MRSALICLCVLALAGVAGSLEPERQPQDQQPLDQVEAWVSAGSPGEHHEKLKLLAGRWRVQLVLWPDDDERRKTVWGTATRNWVLGGRFLEERFIARVGETVFRGIGFLGYDNVAEEYVSVWMDNQSTAVKHDTGTFNDGVLSTIGSFHDPISRQPVQTRNEFRLLGENEHVIDGFLSGDDGVEQRNARVVFKRR